MSDGAREQAVDDGPREQVANGSHEQAAGDEPPEQLASDGSHEQVGAGTHAPPIDLDSELRDAIKTLVALELPRRDAERRVGRAYLELSERGERVTAAALVREALPRAGPGVKQRALVASGGTGAAVQGPGVEESSRCAS